MGPKRGSPQRKPRRCRPDLAFTEEEGLERGFILTSACAQLLETTMYVVGGDEDGPDGSCCQCSAANFPHHLLQRLASEGC